MKYSEIGEKFNVTVERARQIVAKGERLLKHWTWRNTDYQSWRAYRDSVAEFNSREATLKREDEERKKTWVRDVHLEERKQARCHL